MPSILDQFIPDWNKLDKRAVASHAAAIAKLFAETTPSPIDDFAVSALENAFFDQLVMMTAGGPRTFAAAPLEEQIKEHYARAGRVITPERLAFLLKLLETLGPLILPFLGPEPV